MIRLGVDKAWVSIRLGVDSLSKLGLRVGLGSFLTSSRRGALENFLTSRLGVFDTTRQMSELQRSLGVLDE